MKKLGETRYGQRLFRGLLIAPIILFGLVSVSFLIMGVSFGKVKVAVLANASFEFFIAWFWISLPFILLLREKANVIRLISVLLVYAIYAYAIYIIIYYYEDNTAFAESFVVFLAPSLSMGVIFALYAIDQIVGKVKTRSSAKSSQW